ncbi:hypothetical protein PIB30_098665 [Stylosanthes scabra]|uniref:Uncharacterized protein n=1 Tax=Stylosanthes scabra TaxID=79078 RepID=A0ABU6VVU0_9FABA|nr:hypothetical protein [Stylosanthes scabra]
MAFSDDEHHEEKEHMEQQNLGVGNGRTPAQENFFTHHVGSIANYLGVFRNHYELNIRELPKSLTGKVFTQYAELRANRINTWEQLVMGFCNKFLEEELSMHIMEFVRIPSQSYSWCANALETWKLGLKSSFYEKPKYFL